MGVVEWLRKSSMSTRLCLVGLVAVLIVAGGLVWRTLSPANDAEMAEYGDDDTSHNSVDWGDESTEPEVALSYVAIDEDSLDVWFAQRNCEDVTIGVTLVGSDGTELDEGSVHYVRGDDLSKLKLSFPVADDTYADVADIKFTCDGATFDDSRLAYMLGNAKRERALQIESERLARLDADRSDARAEREAADAEAEAARIRAAEEARREEEARQQAAETQHVAAPAQTVSHVVDGWTWGESYHDLVTTSAEVNGSQTNHFVCNDLSQNRVTILGWDGHGWTPEHWFESNRVGLADGLTPQGLFRVTTKAPADSNASYHAGGAGFDDWMVAYADSYALEDSVVDGYHLRYIDGAGYWSALGFCRGFDRSWYGGRRDNSDGQTYLELADAQWIYDHVEIGSSVLNF